MCLWVDLAVVLREEEEAGFEEAAAVAPERVEEGVAVEAAVGLVEGGNRRAGGTGEVAVGGCLECHCGVVPAVGLSVEG